MLALMFGQLSNRESLRDLVVVLESHRSKCYYLGKGKHVTRSNLAKADESRDCRIFEDFTYRMIDEARRKRCTDIFKLEGNVYAFDSTTIDLCLSEFEWAKFRTTKGGVKVHTIYDIEARVPVFVQVTPAAVHDVEAMDIILYEPGLFHIFGRGYNDFKRLYRIRINVLKSFFVIRSKCNLKYKIVKWKRRRARERSFGCRDRVDELLSVEILPRTDETRQVLGRGARTRVHVPDQRHRPQSPVGRRALQEPLADRAVLQVVEATSQNQEVLGHFGERCEDSNLRCHHHLLSGGCCSTRHVALTLNLRGPSDTEHLVNRQDSAQGSLR